MSSVAVALEPVQMYAAEFDSFEKTLDPAEPEWLRRARKAAIERFQQIGFPTLKHGEWKYTNLTPVLKVPFKPAILGRPDGVVRERLEPYTFGVLKASLLVFVNGRYAPKLSYLRPLPEGVRAMNMAEALREDARAVEPHLARHARYDTNPFTALNTAFLQDGAFIEVPRGVVIEEPIHLLYASTSKDVPLLAYPRNLIVLGARSEATVIETYAGWAPDVYLTNAVTEVVAGPGSVLAHYKMQRESESAYHFGAMAVAQDRDTNVACHSISLGAGLARSYVDTIFREDGGSLLLNGLSMTSGTQQADNYTRIDHSAQACTSMELYKGILNDKSRGVFNGNIIVRHGAQKTVARQTNKNLLLSREAFVDSTPGLEILADDVKCTHSSTIGQLDENAIFYLRTRGIDEEAARNILTYAFVGDVMSHVKVAPIKIKLNRLILSRLPKGAALGETL